MPSLELNAGASASEYREAWNRVKEYVSFVRRTRGSNVTEVEADILRAYETVLLNWAKEKGRAVYPLVRICCGMVRLLLALLWGA